MAFLPNTEYLKTLSNSEYEILEYIIKSPSKVSQMTVQELATNTFVSTASIMRLCKKLGYSGFTELKYRLKTDEQIALSDTTITFSDIQTSILSDITKTSNLINHPTIEAVTNLLLSSKRIHLFSKGISNCALDYFSKYLLTCSRDSVLYTDTHIAHLNAARMSEQDVLIVASLSGSTSQVLKTVQVAKAHGATIIAFTKMNNNPIANLSTYNFYISTSESRNDSFDTQSRAGMFYIIDLIIANYVKQLD